MVKQFFKTSWQQSDKQIQPFFGYAVSKPLHHSIVRRLLATRNKADLKLLLTAQSKANLIRFGLALIVCSAANQPEIR